MDKYSITAEGSVEFVTLFNVSRTNRQMVRCHSGLCNIHQGSKRRFENLFNAENLCSHLIEFRNFWTDSFGAMNPDRAGEIVAEENDVVDDSYLPNEKVTYKNDKSILYSWMPMFRCGQNPTKIIIMYTRHFQIMGED